ncbi:MAG: Rab family GTPase [Thermoplasmata archaeon]
MKEIMCKTCMCGDPAVGKTSLVRRFVTGHYNEEYKSTLGTVVYKKNVQLETVNREMKMMLWDISGQAEFQRVHTSAFKNSNGALVVCDLTRKDTVENIGKWIDNLKDTRGKDVPIIILGNKYDMIEGNTDRMHAVSKMIEPYPYPLLFTSAKTGKNVNKAFQRLSENIYEVNNGHDDFDMAKYKKDFDSEIPLPQEFEDSGELIDYLMESFIKQLGDYEMGMHMFRKQIDDENIDVENLTRPQAEKLAKKLISIIEKNKGGQKSTELQRDLKRACQRWNRW